jgi:hypothetical protein
MFTRIGMVLALMMSVPAQAEIVDINIHQPTVSLSAPSSDSRKVCLEMTLAEGQSAQDYLANIEVLAGPGLDPQANQMPYLYRLVPEQASASLVRFRGLQLTDRSNKVEVRATGGRTLAEVAESQLNTKSPLILMVNENCQ